MERTLSFDELTPAGQRWTRSTPTEPGWYWWRNMGDCAEIVHVVDGNIALLCGDMGVLSVGSMLGDGTGEWQGPIVPNEAKE